MPLRESARRLLRLDALLVRRGADGGHRFLEDLLAWSTGERTWATAAEDYAREGGLVEAAGAVLRVSNDDGVRDSLRERLEKQWNEQRADMLRQSEALSARSEQLSAISLEPDWREFLDDANRRLEACGERLGHAISLAALARMEPGMIRDVQRDLKEAADALDMVSDELAERSARRRAERKKLALDITAIVLDLSEDKALEQEADRLSAIKEQAYKDGDIGLLERVLAMAKALQIGESVDIGALERATPASQAPAPESRKVPVAEQYPSRSPRAPAHVDRPASRPFSSLTRQNLAENVADSRPKNKRGYRFDTYEPARMESDADLQDDIAATLQYLGNLEPSAASLDRAMGVYLLQQAKLYLVERSFLNARTVFGDALIWLSDYADTGSESEISLHAWRSTGVWGFALAFLLLHEQRQDAQRILARKNLETLFRYPFGELPLALLDREGLFEEFGRQVLLLGSPTADDVIRYFLSDYLDEHPVAKQEFSSGLFRQSSSDLATLQRILGLLLVSSIDDGPDLVRQITELTSALEHKPEAIRARRFRSDLRTLLSTYAPRYSLIDAIVEGLTHLDESLRSRSDAASEYPIASMLLTRTVMVGKGIESRIILSVTGDADIAPLFGLRLDVSLLDEHGRVVKNALDDPPIIDCVRAGERREVPIPIRGTPEQVQAGRRIRAVYSVADPQGTWQRVRVHYESFAIAIEVASGRKLPPTPYIVGDAVTTRDRIFGREDQIERIYQSLRGRDQDNVVFVLGDRRIGKTTLLNALGTDPRITERYPLVVQVDLQDLDHRSTTFFGRLIDRIQQRLRESGHSIHQQVRRQLQDDPGYVFRKFMLLVDQDLQLRGQRMLLILDELEKVYKSIAAATTGGIGLPKEVIASLRAAIQECRQIGFVLAGVTDVLKKQIASPDDRLFKLALIVELDPLDSSSARQLIEQPVKREYEVATQAADYLASQTGGHPYLLQCVCHHLYLHMTRRYARLATMSDVEDVLEREILPDVAFFSYLTEPWRDNKEDYSLLRAVAHLQASQRYQFGDRYRPRVSYVSVPDIQRRAARSGIMLEEERIRERLLELCDMMPTVIARSRDTVAPRFRLQIGLLARHLRWLERSSQDLVLRE